ncbi:neuronal pentraxin-2b isoform X1 [Sinocyclocheilus grahami]|uniref:Neuronal pentraxin-2-like n=1 Tax=Sinocyclocheilus grahami TaxID=75366 RepID=A0A672PI38_SINGR|nr:PREDICTED: neuronal pentraxin-2-like isoform X1 [Sinocyclocheilus grahami]
MLHLLAGLTCIYALACVKVVYGQNEKGERFLCTAVPIDKGSCPVQSLPVQSASVREEELRNTGTQLRETILQQKETIDNQLETIKELTSKLSRCEADSETFRKMNKDTMDDVPKDPNDTMQSLKDRLENLEQQQMRANISGASFPNELRNLLQRRLEDLENQLLVKVNELEEEKSQLYNETVAHRQRTDSTLNSLMNRISELEKGGAGFKSPENFKISLPLRTNYLFGQVKKSLPEMYAFTICMWLKSGLSPGIGTPFSYGVPGQANEIVLIEWGHNPIELLINDKVAQLPLSLSDGRWHHVCITWTTRDGLWEAYQDGQRLGSGENLAPWHPIKPGGVLILGQEQDVVGGRFDATQAFVGELSHFNVWDRVLRSTDIIAMSNCSSYIPGNVVAWTDSNIEVFGGASKWPLELCEDRLFDN